MVDFISEVEEELRKDKYNALLRKFGPYIVGLIVAIVAVTGYLEWREHSDATIARSASASYMDAARLTESGDLDAAITKYSQLAAVAPSGYAGSSYASMAAILMQQGKYDEAVAAYDRAAQEYEQTEHSDLSRLKAIYILLDQERYEDVRARAAALIGPDAPYSDLAREAEAAALLGLGKSDEALQKFTYLSNAPGTLAGVQVRAEQAVLLQNSVRKQVPPPAPETPNSPETPSEDAPTPEESE